MAVRHQGTRGPSLVGQGLRIGSALSLGAAITLANAEGQAAPSPTTKAAMVFVADHSRQFGTGICHDDSREIHISNTARFAGGKIIVSSAMEGGGTTVPRRTYSMSVSDWDQVTLGTIYYGCPADGRDVTVTCKGGAQCVTVTEGGTALPPMHKIDLRIFPPAEATRVWKAIGVIHDPSCFSNPGCSF